MSEKSREKISIRQIKAARALLGWSQHVLAERSGVSYQTIARLESAKQDDIGGWPQTRDKLAQALAAAGIEFLRDGMRLERATGAPADEIEITPEMIEAGESVLDRALDDAELPASWRVSSSVKDIYIAMDSARGRTRK